MTKKMADRERTKGDYRTNIIPEVQVTRCKTKQNTLIHPGTNQSRQRRLPHSTPPKPLASYSSKKTFKIKIIIIIIINQQHIVYMVHPSIMELTKSIDTCI